METNNKIQKLNYEGNQITFDCTGEKIKINATEMARSYGPSKKPTKWLRTDAAKEFIEAFSVGQKWLTADLVEVRQGGKYFSQGTFMHEDIAFEYARWLDPFFAIWCNQKVKELLINENKKNLLNVEPINGVYPLVHGDKIGYPRIDLLQSMGKSYRNGTVSGRKKRIPGEHLTIGRTACYSRKLAWYMYQTYKQSGNQIRIFTDEFNYKMSVMELVEKVEDKSLRDGIAEQLMKK